MNEYTVDRTDLGDAISLGSSQSTVYFDRPFKDTATLETGTMAIGSTC